MRRLLDRAFEGIANSRIITAEDGVNEVITFPHLVGVYKQAPLEVSDEDHEASDVSYIRAVSVYSGQRCKFIATPEVESIEIQGRTNVRRYLHQR